MLLGQAGAPATEPEGAEAVPADTDEPVRADMVEVEKVRLVLLDVIAIDKDGRTVPDLTAEEFRIVAAGQRRPIDTLDVNCPIGATNDPTGVTSISTRRPPDPSGVSRKIVLAVDYLHLNHTQRAEVLHRAGEMVEHGFGPGEEIMLVALNGGLRVEQPFTKSKDEISRSLRRMQYDVSLWQPDYLHLSERGFVDGMTVLFEVLGKVPGTKAVVLFSAMQDVPLDIEFKEIAAVASASRCLLYPVDVMPMTGILKKGEIPYNPG
jgi:VWFA-related protein